jgi:hypothetical protein
VREREGERVREREIRKDTPKQGGRNIVCVVGIVVCVSRGRGGGGGGSRAVG